MGEIAFSAVPHHGVVEGEGACPQWEGFVGADATLLFASTDLPTHLTAPQALELFLAEAKLIHMFFERGTNGSLDGATRQDRLTQPIAHESVRLHSPAVLVGYGSLRYLIDAAGVQRGDNAHGDRHVVAVNGHEAASVDAVKLLLLVLNKGSVAFARMGESTRKRPYPWGVSSPTPICPSALSDPRSSGEIRTWTTEPAWIASRVARGALSLGDHESTRRCRIAVKIRLRFFLSEP